MDRLCRTFETFFTANDITDVNKRRALLLNTVGASTYRLIKTLSLLKSPKDLTFKETVEKVTTHYNPKPSIVIKQFEFNTRVQKEDSRICRSIAKDNGTLQVRYVFR